MKRIRPLLSYLMIAGGSFLLFLGARDFLESRLGQSSAEREFQSSPQTSESYRGEVPPALQLGETFAKLSIPRLDAQLYVVEGDGEGELRRGPGHLAGSAQPGAKGNWII